jgi:hypothetical protein
VFESCCTKWKLCHIVTYMGALFTVTSTCAWKWLEDTKAFPQNLHTQGFLPMCQKGCGRGKGFPRMLTCIGFSSARNLPCLWRQSEGVKAFFIAYIHRVSLHYAVCMPSEISGRKTFPHCFHSHGLQSRTVMPKVTFTVFVMGLLSC